LRSGRRYDLILDTIGNLSVRDLRRALAEGGKAAVVGFTSVAKLISVSLRGGRNIAQVSAHVATTDLEFLSNLIEAGKVRPHIDRRYPGGFNWSLQHLDGGGVRGQTSGVDAGVDRQGVDEVAGQAVAAA
jgi:NADPH:quinone reductase-like Zn-dependent oxidoreductase